MSEGLEGADVELPKEEIIVDAIEEQVESHYNLSVRDLFLYLFGNREAIIKVARNSSSFWYGAFFVFMAGIAREYDQELITESIGIYLAPFIASTLMVLWVMFWFAAHTKTFTLSIRRSRFKDFLSLFWMTGPLAFLYAIPVEEMFDSLTAVRVNLYFLTLVAIWRVILFARVLHVCTGVNFYAGLICCCSGISIPALMFSSMSIVGIMSGSALSPEQQILKNYTNDALGIVFFVFLLSLPIAVIQMARFKGVASFPEKEQKGKLNFILIIFLLAVGILGLLNYQGKVERHVEFNSYLWDKQYEEALDFASRYEKVDFAGTRTIVPGRTNSRGYFLFNKLKEDHAEWVKKEVYRWVEISLSVKWERGRSEGLKAMFQKESYLSSDFEFLKQHKSRINIVLSDEYMQRMQYKDKDYSIFEVYKKLQSLGLLDENNTKRLLDYEEAIKS